MRVNSVTSHLWLAARREFGLFARVRRVFKDQRAIMDCVRLCRTGMGERSAIVSAIARDAVRCWGRAILGLCVERARVATEWFADLERGTPARVPIAEKRGPTAVHVGRFSDAASQRVPLAGPLQRGYRSDQN